MRVDGETGGVDRDDPGRSEDGMLVRRRSAGTGAARDTAQGTQTERMACWWWPQTPRQIPRGPRREHASGQTARSCAQRMARGRVPAPIAESMSNSPAWSILSASGAGNPR